MGTKVSERSDHADAFLRESELSSGAGDDLAQRLGEEYLKSAAGGDDAEEESREQQMIEEMGGPFLESRAEDEFGHRGRRSTVETRIEEEASALPQAVGSLAIGSAEEGLEASEERNERGDDDEAPGLDDPEAEPESRLLDDYQRLEAHLRTR